MKKKEKKIVTNICLTLCDFCPYYYYWFYFCVLALQTSLLHNQCELFICIYLWFAYLLLLQFGCLIRRLQSCVYYTNFNCTSAFLFARFYAVIIVGVVVIIVIVVSSMIVAHVLCLLLDLRRVCMRHKQLERLLVF